MFMFNDYCDSLELYARGLAQHCLRDRGQTSQHVAPCAWCGLRFHMVLQTFSWGIHKAITIACVWRHILSTLCRQGALDGDGDTERDGVEWGDVDQPGYGAAGRYWNSNFHSIFRSGRLNEHSQHVQDSRTYQTGCANDSYCALP